MRRFLILSSALFFALDLPTVGQSASTELKSDGEKNERSLPPSPAPTPPREVPPAEDDSDVIRVSTSLVSVPVRVMDKSGRFIAGLGKENFRVFEDGAEQEVALFSNEHEPFTLALVLDMSYSAKFKLVDIQSAAVAFIDQLRPQDKVLVLSFDAEVHVHCEATTDRKEIYRAIKSTKIGNGTSLYEAVDMVMNNRLRDIEGRKAIILFTDGVDTASRRSHDHSNLSDAMELDALIYPIRYDTFADVQRMKNGPVISSPPPITIPAKSDEKFPFPTVPAITRPGSQGTTPEEYRKAEEYLSQLAQRTGGRVYEATTFGNLSAAYSRIASELREFYSLGYYPTTDRIPGKRTSVKVKVDKDGLVVKSREGFARRKPNR